MVLKAGSMVDFGPVTETLNRHGFDRDTMDREGAILSGIARKIDRELDLMEVEIGADTLFLPREEGRQIGDVVPILIRASDVALALQPPEGLSIRNALRGRVASIRRLPNSAFAEVGVDLGVLVLPVRITRAAVEALSLRAGQNIWALVKTTTLAG
jgi:molybdate transport system ATP-binding protein